MIYLDHNATSPLLEAALDAMRPWLGKPANPASMHRAGQAAHHAVEQAREQVATCVGVQPSGVVFTSGATEANHLFLRGLGQLKASGVLAYSGIEHPCVQAAAKALEALGWSLCRLDCDRNGQVVLGNQPFQALSLMAANHETGVIQPLDQAWDLCQAQNAWLHVDATQAAGRIDLTGIRADALVVSSHKIGGPCGVGALALRTFDTFPPLFGGGAQERGRRAGTVPVALVVGFGAACEQATQAREARHARWHRQRQQLQQAVLRAGGRMMGATVPRVANTLCAVFDGLVGELLVQSFDLHGLCVSAGAACASGSVEPSPVLQAMGDPSPSSAVRFSLGPATTDSEIERAAALIPKVVGALRRLDATEHGMGA